MDLSIAIYVHGRSEYLACILGEIFEQAEGLDVEILMIDGRSMYVDFDKVDQSCRDHGIKNYTVVRPSDGQDMYQGFHNAAVAAEGRVLAFLNPGVHLPADFLKTAIQVGSCGKVWLPRPWVNVVSKMTETWGFYAPPDALTIITPRSLYGADLTGETIWRWPEWAPKTAAYELALRLVGDREKRDRAGVAVMEGYEYRTWTTADRSTGYLSEFESYMVSIDDWVFSENDIRRFSVLGVPFERVVEPLPPAQDPKEVENLVEVAAASVCKRGLKPGSSPNMADLRLQMQRDLDEEVDRLFADKELVLRPVYSIEPGTKAGTFRVVSTNNVLLPHEH